MTTTPATPRFTPADFDPSDWSRIEPFGKALLDRPIDSPVAMHDWLVGSPGTELEFAL